MATATRPGAMSLLDKYASINSSIEDARRRVAEVRTNLERTNEKIHNLREERNGMIAETEAAKSDRSSIEAGLKRIKGEQHTKQLEKDGVLLEHQLAKTTFEGARRRIDQERLDFLERCREFRASCKRMRVAASLLVLDGGGNNFDAKDAASDGVDLWRRLEEVEFSDDDEEEEGGVVNNNGNTNNTKKRKKHKKVDPDLEQAEQDEKDGRQALIEAECALHAVRSSNADAVKRSNARTLRLTQQRAQLQRHRKEVEELEREIQTVKDDVVHENQLANTFEKECNKRKQIREANANAAYTGGAFSNNFKPPTEESRTRNNTNNPYNNNPYRTHQNTTASAGYQQQQRPRGNATNPYNNPYKTSRKAPTPPRANEWNNTRRAGQNSSANSQPRYASDMLGGYGVTSESGMQGQRNVHQQHQARTQQQPRGRNTRNQRQFGTSVGVSHGSSSNDGMTDELRECMEAFSSDAQGTRSSSAATATAQTSGGVGNDDVSDISSTSSDEDILEFEFFGSK